MSIWRSLARLWKQGIGSGQQERLHSCTRKAKERQRLSCELLEGRCLPSGLGTITEYPLPTSESYPLVITSGPDGNLWFTEYHANKIGRLSHAGITEFPVPTASSLPGSITSGPDGNLWFTEYGANQIGKITKAGVIQEFPLPTPNSKPADIKVGPDHNLWFAEYGASQIGRITLTGAVSEFPVPTAGSEPLGLTLGPDGNLWFTEFGAAKIGKITRTGHVTEYPTLVAGSAPGGITAGPDGNLWFTDLPAGNVGRVTPTGTFTEFPIPTATTDFAAITVGADGNLWFAEYGGNKIGQITLDGTITEFSIPTPSSDPFGITIGADLNIWFTEAEGNKLGRLLLPVAARGLSFYATEGVDAVHKVAYFRDVDPTALFSNFTAQVNWGDGTTSEGAIVQPGGAGKPFYIQGHHTYAEERHYRVSVTIHDSADDLTITAYSLDYVADAPLHATGISISAKAGTPFTATLASFIDSDPGGTLGDYKAFIDWGDHHSSAGTIVQNSDGTFAVSGGHTYATAGTFTITVVISDVGGSRAKVTSTATVSGGSAPLPWTLSNEWGAIDSNNRHLWWN